MNIEVGSAKSLKSAYDRRGVACAYYHFLVRKCAYSLYHRKEWLQYANWEVRRLVWQEYVG